MDKDIKKTTFFKALEAFPYEKFQQIVSDSGCDRYIKKAKTLKLFYLMIISQFLDRESLRDIAGFVRYDESVREILHLTSISASTLSRRLKHIKHSVWEETFSAVKTETWIKAKNKAFGSANYRLNIIDSSTISLCLSRFLWADFRKTKGGIKLHQSILVHEGNTYPDHAVLTTARKADKNVMDELVVTADNVLNVFDRGYVDYAKWDVYCQHNVRFVSRLKSNASVEVLKESSNAGSEGLKERIVILGCRYTTQMAHPLRLIETYDQYGNLVTIVTNDMTLPVEEISNIYRLRWQIEIFFKWLKQHMVIKKFYGTSPNAVYGQIWLALIGYCLLKSLSEQLPKKITLFEVLRAVKVFLFKLFSEMVATICRGPSRKSCGRSPSIQNEIDGLLREISQKGTYALDAVDTERMYL